MNNLETLKQELITQKSLIEKMSGVVSVAGSNPSPSEITAGIKTIPASDLTMSTATEEDVKQGKTFFSGNSQLKTGTAIMDANTINHLFMVNKATITSEDPVYYTCPSDLKLIKRYLFYYNYNTIHFTFNDTLTEIEDYAFYMAPNMVFYNFENLKSLKKIGNAAFYCASCEGLNFEFNDSLQSIAMNAFYNCMYDGATIKLPVSLQTLSSYAFTQDTRKNSCYLDTSECVMTSFVNNLFQYIAFENDFVVPQTVTSIGDYFNYNGSFRNIIIHDKVMNLKNYCFGGITSLALSLFYLKTVVFEAETPPTFGNNVFALQNIDNGFKIYVPDSAIEEYRAATNLSSYVDCIHPISEKE